MWPTVEWFVDAGIGVQQFYGKVHTSFNVISGSLVDKLLLSFTGSNSFKYCSGHLYVYSAFRNRLLPSFQS